MASTGACVRPSILKVQGGNILMIAAPGVEARKPAPKAPNQIAKAAAAAPAVAPAAAAAPVVAAPAAAKVVAAAPVAKP